MIVAEVSARNDSGELWRRHFHVEEDGRLWSEGICSGVWDNNRTYANVEELVSDYRAYSAKDSRFIRVSGRITDAGMLIPAFFERKEAA